MQQRRNRKILNLDTELSTSEQIVEIVQALTSFPNRHAYSEFLRQVQPRVQGAQ